MTDTATTEEYLLAQQDLQDLRVRIVNKDPTVTAAQMAQVILNLRRGRASDPATKAATRRTRAKTKGPDTSQISILDLMERPVDR